MARQVARATCTCCKSIAFLCLFLLVLLRSEPVLSFVLHNHSPGGSPQVLPKLSDGADLTMSSDDAATADIRQEANLDKQSHLPTVDEEFNHEVLGESDSGRDSGHDGKQFQSAHGFEAAAADIKAESLLSIEASTADNASNVANESEADKLGRLIREINAESKREKEENQVDNSFQEAEELKAKLDFEINRTRLVLMRLRSLQRNVADAHSLAKKMVESDVVSKHIKDYAVNHLDKSVEKVKKVLVKM